MDLHLLSLSRMNTQTVSTEVPPPIRNHTPSPRLSDLATIKAKHETSSKFSEYICMYLYIVPNTAAPLPKNKTFVPKYFINDYINGVLERPQNPPHGTKQNSHTTQLASSTTTYKQKQNGALTCIHTYTRNENRKTHATLTQKTNSRQGPPIASGAV